MISALTHVVEEGQRLTEDELIGTCVLLLNAGHEATVNVTGNGWWALFRNPEQLALLRTDPSLVPRAVEELMRYDTPLQMFERWVLEDSGICGVRVPKGSELGLLFGSANRDPSVFHLPDGLDITRQENPHLSFGPGSTSAWERRWPGSSWRPRSPPSFAGFRGWSWRPSHDGSPLTSSGGWESSGSGSEGQGVRGLALGDRRVGRSRRDARSRHDPPRATLAPDLEHRNEPLTREHLAVAEKLEERGEEEDNPVLQPGVPRQQESLDPHGHL